MRTSFYLPWVVLVVGFWGAEYASAQVGVPPDNPPPGSAGPPPCENPPDQAQVPCLGIASFAEGLTLDDRASILQTAGAVVRFNFHLVNAAAVFVPNESALSTLLNDPRVAALIPDRPIYAIVKPDKPPGKGGGGSSTSTSVQVVPSGVQRIGASPGSLTVTGSGIGVAVVDTGLDFNHADLTVSNDACFTAFVNCQDDHGHGTHVGGIVAALNNSIDVVGVAPSATSYAVKVLDNTGSGTDSTVMAGLDWVGGNANSVTPPIRVVNMSLGRPGTLGDNTALRASIQVLKALGISVVVAAGNDPGKEVSQMVPATYPEVMAVASTTALDGANKCLFYSGFIATDTASYFTTDGAFNTTTGIGVTISAPGEDKENITRGCMAQSVGILSLKLGGGTTRMSGTSMAAPHVAGVVALMEEANGLVNLDPELARGMIRTTAFRIGVAPLNSPTSGYSFDGEREGIVSACGAVGATCP